MILKFKQGKKNNLLNNATSPGTVYITTDTNEMYLDTIDNIRIKITNDDALFFEIQKNMDLLVNNFIILDSEICGILNTNLMS